ncbi:universal stress protein [Psychromonas aquimarina]|uniref:universal stress protein n=1 Tax=Psychromonas aquimarina TaxID=444919 RepID=UPI00048EA860|nr:universal stress protein [Psychromonas aquimarina]
MAKILVILEQEQESKCALDRAIDIAKITGADIHVLIYCYENLSWMNDVFDMIENLRIKDQLIQEKEAWWQKYITAYSNTISITHEVIWEKYFVDAVLTHCEQHEYDFYVKKGRRSESFLHTPSDWLLLRESKIPSYIAAEQQTSNDGKSVLLALDLMASSQEKQKLNQKLLTFGFDFAEKMSLAIHCCFAISPPRILTDIGPDKAQEYCKKIEALACKNANSLLEEFNIPPENIHIKIGAPYEVIDSISCQHHASVVIIGSMGKKLLAGKVIGNTCEEVLHVTKKDMIVLGYN